MTKTFKTINVINNNRENGVKTEDGEIIDNVNHVYIDNECKDLIKDLNIFTCGLKDEDLHWISLKILSMDIGKNTDVFEKKV